MHAEMTLLTESGLTAEAATADPEREFGLIDRGRIQAGRRADLLMIKGDHTTDIRATRDILRVWKTGTAIRDQVARVAEASRKAVPASK